MAVISVNETWHGRQGSVEGHLVFTTRKSDLFVVVYRRTFVVETDDPLDGAQTVLAATGVPKAFDPYVTDTESALDALCRRVDAVQRPDDYEVWDVTAEYSTEQTAIERSPLLRPAEIRWSFRQFTRIAEYTSDFDDKGFVTRVAITNSAKDKFDPPPEMDDSRPVLTIVRNEGAFNPALAYQYRDAVNEDYFFGAAPGVAKLQSISADQAEENGLVYFKVTYEIHFNPDGWKLRILDAGFNRLVDGQRKVITDPLTGHVYSNPQLLNGEGDTLPTVDPPVFLTFDVYRSLPFSALNLP